MMQSLPLKSVVLYPVLHFDLEWINCVFSSTERVWVGFSGGVDSHVLLHLLVSQLTHEQKQKLTAIHVHHGLSEHADDWLEHCQLVCEKLSVNFVAERVKLESQSSLEDAARNARYKVFEQLMGAQGVLLLAHHSGDQTETVLFRLLRGTGGKGLAGIPSQRKIGDKGACLLRPFLDVSKAELMNYALQQQLEWIQDESNMDEHFTRNFLRHSVVPVLKERFPKMEKNIASSVQRITTDYAVLNQFARQQLDDWCNEFGGLDLSIIANKTLDEKLFWLRHFLECHHVSLPHSQLESVESMFSSGESRHPEFLLPNGRLLRHQNTMYIVTQDQIVELGALIDGELFTRVFDNVQVFGGGCYLKTRPQSAVLPMSNGRTRKLKKWLNDQRIPSWWREHLPYIFLEDQLIAIGTLWHHPDYTDIKVEWQLNGKLCFPRFK